MLRYWSVDLIGNNKKKYCDICDLSKYPHHVDTLGGISPT